MKNGEVFESRVGAGFTPSRRVFWPVLTGGDKPRPYVSSIRPEGTKANFFKTAHLLFCGVIEEKPGIP